MFGYIKSVFSNIGGLTTRLVNFIMGDSVNLVCESPLVDVRLPEDLDFPSNL